MDNLRSRGLLNGVGLSLVSLGLARMREAELELTRANLSQRQLTALKKLWIFGLSNFGARSQEPEFRIQNEGSGIQKSLMPTQRTALLACP
jgi:hypothetical protein